MSGAPTPHLRDGRPAASELGLPESDPSALEALARLQGRYGTPGAREAAQRVRDDEAAGANEALDAIAVLGLARRELDHLEADLLEIAHDVHRLPWSRLAAALGMKTRQAAEQRYRRRLSGTTSRASTTK